MTTIKVPSKEGQVTISRPSYEANGPVLLHRHFMTWSFSLTEARLLRNALTQVVDEMMTED